MRPDTKGRPGKLRGCLARRHQFFTFAVGGEHGAKQSVDSARVFPFPSAHATGRRRRHGHWRSHPGGVVARHRGAHLHSRRVAHDEADHRRAVLPGGLGGRTSGRRERQRESGSRRSLPGERDSNGAVSRGRGLWSAGDGGAPSADPRFQAGDRSAAHRPNRRHAPRPDDAELPPDFGGDPGGRQGHAARPQSDAAPGAGLRLHRPHRLAGLRLQPAEHPRPRREHGRRRDGAAECLFDLPAVPGPAAGAPRRGLRLRAPGSIPTGSSRCSST